MNGAPDASQLTRCSNCSAELAPGCEKCPNCQSPVGTKTPSESVPKRIFTWRRLRHLLIAAILLLLPYLPHGLHYLRLKLPLRTSPLVSEALLRANENSEAVKMLGQPISAGWFVKGYIHGDETGWSEGQVWIPVSGPNGEGTLYARGGSAWGPWVFSELRLTQDNGRVVDLLAKPAKASQAKLKASYNVFLVPLGRVRGLGLNELPTFYQERLGLKVELLESIPLEPHVRDRRREQLIVEELVALMRRHLPSIASDESALLIGITDEDMYIRDTDWNFAYSAYRHKERAGVVSSARVVPSVFDFGNKEELLKSRVRKIVTRTIGVMVYHLPKNDDPTSIMYRDLYGSASLDLMSEDFEGLGSRAVVNEFKTAHAQKPREPDLLPGVSEFNEAMVDGRYPCLQFKRRRDDGGTTPVFNATIGKCLQGTFLDTNIEEFEIDLRSGLLLTRTTDLFVPGVIPIAATRCFRTWDEHSRTFGQHTTLSWDMFPVGSRQPYTFIDVIVCDGSRLHFDRISKGTGYADALYEHRQTATPFLRSRFGWNGNGWDLKLKDGSLFVFPESYYAKKPVDGALISFRDAKGHKVKIERDKRRNLKRITTPDGRFIVFEHDASDRIIKAVDDERRELKYLYDQGGRLVQVDGPRSVTRYAYEGTYLKSVEENGRRLVSFNYADWGRVDWVSLPDRQAYLLRYEYNPRDERQVTRTIVTGPDGSVTKFDIKPE